ncbi:SGNH/GDSL hydrolase family protein [Streptomyces sp. YS-3]|uniref:SGNH/GDSL hydrolase family protein n=1 Tax=Streptomyces sp. YS-3 TaxID=3381352 RepID=UPI003862D253
MKLSRMTAHVSSIFLTAAFALTGAGVASAATHAQAAGTDYVALGDSYSSGVGTGTYDSSSGSCKRSPKAYPSLWAASHAPASFAFTACSGATTDDVKAGQLGPLNSSTDLVSITIGGNDAGFSDVMTTCVLNSQSTCLNRINQARTYADTVLPAKLDSVYDAIRAKAPNAHVVVIGYPHFYKIGGSCFLGLSDTSRAAINSAADELNTVTAKRAADHGYSFASVVPAFTNHEICSSSSWLNSLVWTNIGESYHPTAAGQSGGYLPTFANAA